MPIKSDRPQAFSPEYKDYIQNLAGEQRAAHWRVQAYGPAEFQDIFRRWQAGSL